MTKEVTKTIIKEIHKETPAHHQTHPNNNHGRPYHHKVIKPRNFNQKPKRIEDKIAENLIELQKTNVSLAEKFDRLSNQIAMLLNLFENAAKSFATNPAMQVSEKDRDFLEKVDKLLEQNKVIAKGLTLMEENMREKLYGEAKKVEDIKESIMEKPVKEEKPVEEFLPSPNRPLPKF